MYIMMVTVFFGKRKTRHSICYWQKCNFNSQRCKLWKILTNYLCVTITTIKLSKNYQKKKRQTGKTTSLKTHVFWFQCNEISNHNKYFYDCLLKCHTETWRYVNVSSYMIMTSIPSSSWLLLSKIFVSVRTQANSPRNWLIKIKFTQTLMNFRQYTNIVHFMILINEMKLWFKPNLQAYL